MKKIRIDMHMHSIYSDGFYSPQELVAEGKKNGLQAMSLTDHDSMEGSQIMLEECKKNDIIGISGIEFSAMREREIHILGYGLDPTKKDLLDEITYLQNEREKRNIMILEKLKKVGFDVSIEEMRSFSEHIIGRGQIAMVMLKKGYVKSLNEAFDKWMGSGKPCFSPSYKKSPEEIVSLIVRHGGKAVLAHPGRMKIVDQESLVKDLKERGLFGIETYYSTHSFEDIKKYEGYAKKYDLVATVGSDFHIDGRGVKIGRPEKMIDMEIIEAMLI